MPNVSLPWFSVVVPTYGEVGVELTNTCLQSLRENHANMHPEIFVVDDGSGEKVVDELSLVCAAHDATLIAMKVNGGFAKAVNAGMKQANAGGCVILVNNDIVFDKCPTLQIMAETIRVMNCGVVGTRLLYPDNTIQHAGVVFVPTKGQPTPGYWDHIGRGLDRNNPIGLTLTNSLVTGALFGINRHLINAIGLLDERYGMSCEDIDYCMESVTVGMPCTYQGFAWAYHAEGKTRGRTPEEKNALNPEAWAREKEGLDKFFEKWCSVEWAAFSGQGG